MFAAIEAYIGSVVLGYIKKMSPHDKAITGHTGPDEMTRQDHTMVATVSSNTANDEGSDDSANYNSDSESDEADSDHVDSPYIPEAKNKKSQRRSWSDLEDSRLRARVEEKKNWAWIANKMGRSTGAVEQHWRIMEKQDGKTAKK
jgi:hypothetical protein